MSLTGADLGAIGDLAKALGLLDASGDFNGGWLSSPGDHVKHVLADDGQRAALVNFVHDAIGGSAPARDAAGLVWLPAFERPAAGGPSVTVYVVLDDGPADHVRIGVGVAVVTSDGAADLKAHVPIFRAAKLNHAGVADPVVLGTADGVIDVSVEITIDDPTIKSASLTASVPTGGTAGPTLALALKGLELPGAPAPRDLTLSLADLAELESTVLQLVLGLVRAQVGAAGTGALAALAGLLGVRDGSALPPLPIEDVLAHGLGPLRAWLEGVISGDATRAVWLAELADLLGGSADTEAVEFTLGPVRLRVGARAATGTTGHSKITVFLAAESGPAAGPATASVTADLATIDLGAGSAAALPGCTAAVVIGKQPSGAGSALLVGDPAVDRFVIGLSLDGARRPTLHIAAEQVTIGTHHHDVIDLSSPGAVADAAGTVVGDVADTLLAELGPAVDSIKTLLGVTAPAGFPAVPTLDLAQLLRDPLGAVAGFWNTLVSQHADAVPTVLAVLRDLVADAGVSGQAVTGTGTEADPWRVPVVAGAELRVWTAGGVLTVGVGAGVVVVDLGQRCTRLEANLTAGLVALDLAGRHASFLPLVSASFAAKGRVANAAQIDLGPLSFTADQVGLEARWAPAKGFAIDILAPNLAFDVNGTAVPVALPVFAADGTVTLDDAGWDALEGLLGTLAAAAPIGLPGDIARAFGWSLRPAGQPVDGPHLRLATLHAEPASAIRAWLADLALQESDQLVHGLRLLARGLSGAAEDWGSLAGSGSPEDPWQLDLDSAPAAPSLVAWLEPDGAGPPAADLPAQVAAWQSADDPLGSELLAQAVRNLAANLPQLGALARGRNDLAAGLEALVTRWDGSDGRVIPPPSPPAGVTVQTLPGAAFDGLATALDLQAVLGRTPATTVHVSVGPNPWATAAPADRIVMLDTAGLAPEAFPQPSAQAGDWFVVLAGRAEAKLATGDPDGIAGQAARLERVLGALAGIDSAIAVVATAEAGHAAVRGAGAVSAVTDVVTLGTPWSPVTMSVIDVAPAAEAIRMLAAIAPAPADGEAGSDAATGRSLLSALTAGFPLDDPVRELRPPATEPGPFRAGLNVVAAYGVVGEQAIRRAITAVVAGGLSALAAAADAAPPAPPAALRTGLRLPLAVPAATGLAIGGHVTVELLGAAPGGGTPIELATDRAVHVHLELTRVGGWLVGGPDPARVPGSRHDIDLRGLDIDVTVPLTAPAAGGADRAVARLLLHEVRVFGLTRPRWVVRTTGSALAADEATPALPEVRVVLSALTEAITGAAAADPILAAALAALKSLGVVDASGGSVPDAVDHLLHDPVAFTATVMADAGRRSALATALRSLTGGNAAQAPDQVTWTAGPATVTLDLGGRRASVDIAGAGAVPWTLHAQAGASAPDVQLVLGAAGSSPAGGGRVTFATQPALSVTGEWHRPGAGAPVTIRIWPNPDAAAVGLMAARLLPAELARVSLEYLRRMDDTVRPVVDVALDAIGLLAAAPAGDGLRPLRLPLGLVSDPLSWLSHAGALGGAGGGLDPARTVALFDALKPILGFTDTDPGVWTVATGLKVRADSNNGHLRIGAELDTAGLAAAGAADDRLEASFTAALTLPPGQVPQPALDLALGLTGAAPGHRAVHVSLDGGLSVFIRPAAGADIPLYPNPPGLGQLASAAAHALPLVLNAIAAETGGDAKGEAGAVVRALGDALGLRTGSPAEFTDAALQAWAADPAASFAARLPTIAAAELNGIAGAVGSALPPGLTATVAGNELRVALGSMTLGLTASPFGAHFVAAPGIPGLDNARVEAAVDTGGLTALDVTVGPAVIAAGQATLRPFLRVHAGTSPAGGRRVELGLALDDAGTKGVAARWLLGGAFGLISIDGSGEHTEPDKVTLAVLDAVVELAGSVVVGTAAVGDLLARHCGSATVGAVLDGVIVHKPAADWELVDGLFDPAELLGRLQQLALNLVRVAQPKLDLAELSLALVESPPGTLGIELIPKDRYNLGGDDVTIALDFDASWIEETPAPAPGLTLSLLQVGPPPGPGAPPALTFKPGIEVDGIGFRVARSSGPLLEVASVTLDSIGLHLYGRVGAGGLGGGIQLQLSDLAVGTAGAGGGNQIAQGVMKDAGSGQTKLAPKFSPAVAVQKQPGADVLVTLRAGDQPGPWWLAIQKGFGPVYIEQVGFDAKVQQRHLQSISILLDGSVSIFGLSAAVDDLSLTFVVASNASVFDPSRWAVDLAGFAISSNLGGVELAGGLRKFTDPRPPGQPDSVQYIGMLLARFGVYGLSVFGGYGAGRAADGSTFASFFAFGAVNGPIGGPPAFFLTGIGGGLGINRGLVFPQELNNFETFPFIQALDPGATPPSDPMAVLDQYKDTFPVKQGEFWFAAGISFNSFALVDGVAVVAITVGDGFELALLGLARMALPRPQFALVSIELGLICRFSTKEGVLWIQAQLTDNSWLLFPEVRLTGGFAFVSWFKGPNRGQFVLTIGGYHPSFHRDGYPVVPRLGFHVDLGGAITIVGESYFALTSEALMAGGKLEASATLGPAWAHVVFGADGIVFFDPFYLDVRVYASISAGISIDVWIGTITISISIGAEIHVMGPKFHGDVTFDIGPVSVTFSFGDAGDEPHYIDFPTFVRKYLEEAPDGAARALSAITGRGSITPKPGAGGAKDVATADGSAAKPFVVTSEFECLVTTTVPFVEARVDGIASSRSDPSQALGVAPMGKPRMEPALRLRLFDSGGHDHLPDLLNEAGQPRILVELRDTGAFPVAVWGLPQNKDAKKVPVGDVITACEGVRLDLHAKIEPGLPPVAYNQVETGDRRPLPFVRPAVRASLTQEAAALAALVPAGQNVCDVARHVMAKAGNSTTAITALSRDRAAPPRLGSLTEGLATDGLPLGTAPVAQPVAPPVYDHRVLPPRATALMTPTLALPERLAVPTTVKEFPQAPRLPAPTLLSVRAQLRDAVSASLRRVGVAGAVAGGTVVANGAVPVTRPGTGPVAAIRGRGTLYDGQQRLNAHTVALAGQAPAPPLDTGEVIVLQLPNAARDAAQGQRPSLAVGGPARVVLLAHAGTVLADELDPQQVTVPPGTERIAVLALGDRENEVGSGLLSGWHAGQLLPAVGWNCALGSRCLLSAEGITVKARRQRTEAGWVKGAELTRGTTTVTTRFTDRPRAIAIVLDEQLGAQDGHGLAMTLSGAVRMVGQDGRPLAPTVVSSGARSAVVYPIAPGEGAVAVTVASESTWALAGVLGGSDVVAVTDVIAARGIDASVRPIAAGGGTVELSWKSAIRLEA